MKEKKANSCLLGVLLRSKKKLNQLTTIWEDSYWWYKQILNFSGHHLVGKNKKVSSSHKMTIFEVCWMWRRCSIERTCQFSPLYAAAESKTLSPPVLPNWPIKRTTKINFYWLNIERFLMKLMPKSFISRCISVLHHLKLTKACTSVC